MESIDELKRSTGKGTPKYSLENANVFVSQGGYHYIDYLDPVDNLSPDIDESELTDEIVAYLEEQLQWNSERFENQLAITRNHLKNVGGKHVLDIGCGGGLFLSMLKGEGAQVTGIELSDARAHYAKTTHDIEVIKCPIDNVFWQDRMSSFDAVTLWDVIEHVNYPEETLKHSVDMLKTGGLLFIDTPCRDGFYHRFGEFTYKWTGGRFPTFLNAMYSAHPFGHKQIFSSAEMQSLFERAGVEVIALSKFHELSFPYRFYLKKLLKSTFMVNLALPVVSVMLWMFPIKNKMLIVGRKM